MLKNHQKNWDTGLLAGFCVVFSQIAAFYFHFIVAFGRPLWGQSLISHQVIATVTTFAMLGTAWLIFRPDMERGRFPAQATLSSLRLLAITVFGALLCVLVSAGVFLGVRALFGARAAQVNIDLGLHATLSWTDIAVLLCTVGILVPLGEELLFRRWLFGRMAAIGRARQFMPTSIIFFGIVHFDQSPVKAVTIMALAALCAWLYVRSRNVLWPWLAHAINNIAALSPALLGWRI